MNKSNHQAKVIRINEIRKHTNADSLEIIPIPGTGYQVVTKIGQFKVGDLGVYIQPDSVVPQTLPFKFIWENYQCEPDGAVPEKRRRITVRKFRREWSEGLLMPVSDFEELISYDESGDLLEDGTEIIFTYKVCEGDDVADLLGITHYDPPEPIDIHVVRKQQYKWPPKSFQGWIYYLCHLVGLDLNGPVGGANEKGPKNPPPVYDVENYRNFLGAFEPGEEVIVTEKIHGSNARYLFDGKKFFVGSRKLWKSAKSKCVWREAVKQNPWIEEWCRCNPGWTLFGEVVPTQGGFNYGAENGQVKFFAFDILAPNGNWLEYSADPAKFWMPGHGVPLIYAGAFSEELIKKFVDGPSLVPGAKHIREGVVVRPAKEREVRGLGRLQLKLVSNLFLEKDSKG